MFNIAEVTARKIEVLNTMFREFTSTAADLALQIAAEEERSRITDPTHVAYSTLAKALAMRRSNLLVSAAEVETRIVEAQRLLDDARVRASSAVSAAENAVPRVA
jgi:flagellar protein FliJ